MNAFQGCYTALAVLMGAASSFGASAILKTADGRELMGELLVTNNQFTILRSDQEQVVVGLTNLVHGRFNLTNLARTLLDTVGGRMDPSLPAPWEARDVGDTGLAGKVTVTRDRFVLEGAGDSFGSDWADAFYFVHRPLRGDGEIIARVVSLDGRAAGVMIRDTSGTNPPVAAIFGQPKDIFSYRDRPSLQKRAPSQTRDRTFVNLPRWVRLKRDGNMFKSYLSWDNGERWEAFHRGPVDMGEEVEVGLFMVAKAKASAGRAEFDHVAVTQAERRNERAGSSFVVLCGGTSIAGDVLSVDGSVVKMSRQGVPFSVSTPNVARLLFDKFAEPTGGGSIPNRPGVLLERNDFIDGELSSLEEGRLKLASVLFGFRTFRPGSQVKAVVLRGLAPGSAVCVIKTRDGSVWQAAEARLEKGDLRVQIPELGSVALPWGDVTEISRQ